MASRKFKVIQGGHVSIYVPWRPTPIEIMEGGTYETDDKQELEALKASPEVSEVKESPVKESPVKESPVKESPVKESSSHKS